MRSAPASPSRTLPFPRLAGRLAWTGIAVLTAATVAALASRWWWVFELFSHFRLQYLALGVCISLVAALLRQPVAAMAAGLLMLPHLLAVAPHLSLASPAQAATGHRAFTLTSLNLLYANQTPEAVDKFVGAERSDILVVQEATGVWVGTLEAVADLYPHVAPADWRRGTDVVVFSRYPLTERAVPSPRVVAVTVNLAGQSIDVIGVHARIPRTAEDAAMRAADYADVTRLAATASGPVVAAGDFNSTIWSPLFRDMLTAGALVDAGERSLAPTWQPSPMMWPLALPIDHVVIGKGLTALKLRRGPDVGSDHRPMSASLQIGQ